MRTDERKVSTSAFGMMLNWGWLTYYGCVFDAQARPLKYRDAFLPGELVGYRRQSTRFLSHDEGSKGAI